MKRKKTLEDILDGDIEREYYKQANGRQIDIMKICSLFAECRRLVTQEAQSVADAVRVSIEQYCEPVRRG